MNTISNSTQDHQGADQPAAAPNPELEHILDLEKIPSDYRSGYKKALVLDLEMASNYVAHAWVGDPFGRRVDQAAQYSPTRRNASTYQDRY